MFFIMTLNFCCSGQESSKEYFQDIDYTKANVNAKKYFQVPKKTIIWGKMQADEPSFFSDGPHKGHTDFMNHLKIHDNAITLQCSP